MFKRIFVLIVVLFAAISCKQNPSSLLSSTPPIADDGTIDDNTDGGNSNGGNTDGGIVDNGTDSSLGYGVYEVFILGDNGTEEPKYVKISDTYEMVLLYSNMMLNGMRKPKFKLYKNNDTSTGGSGAVGSDTGGGDSETGGSGTGGSDAGGSDTTVSDIYTFDENLNIIKEETTDGASKNTVAPTICKKFRGVCIVRIYPDASTTAKSSLLGEYTLAGVYTEMENTAQINTRAMTETDGLQNYGYDELIILRYDNIIPDTTVPSSTDSAVKYRADILFNTGKGINFYYYDPDRTFEKQNTDYVFERIEDKTAS